MFDLVRGKFLMTRRLVLVLAGLSVGACSLINDFTLVDEDDAGTGADAGQPDAATDGATVDSDGGTDGGPDTGTGCEIGRAHV